MREKGAVYTVGHSTREAEELLSLLAAHGIRRVVDVRRFPASRRHPQFGRQALAAALAAEGISYAHEPDLGGRREPVADSPNTAWGVAGFRGYADHMTTEGFRQALARVRVVAARERVAVMCAEALPSRCHRQLIADALVAVGVEVRHIIDHGAPETHVLHPAAVAGGVGDITYPGPVRRGQRRLFVPE